MGAAVHAADIQDRDGGVLLMATPFRLFPFLLKLYADSGYRGPKFQRGLREVCRSSSDQMRTNSLSCPSAGSSSVPSPS
jgi:hypothetical protein